MRPVHLQLLFVMEKKQRVALVGFCGAFALVLCGAFLITLGVFYQRISDEYADHHCNDSVSPFGLAYWLHIQAWNCFGMQIALGVVYIGSLAMACNKWVGWAILVPTGALLGCYALFQVAWTIIGMVEVARAVKCHEHAPELWNWAYAAVLLSGSTFVTVTGVGGGFGSGKK